MTTIISFLFLMMMIDSLEKNNQTPNEYSKKRKENQYHLNIRNDILFRLLLVFYSNVNHINIYILVMCIYYLYV